jgi:formamidopyrimidine-DNA glycosylase
VPELPEVEVLCRHLGPLLIGRTIGRAQVHRAKVVAPDSPRKFANALRGAQFIGLGRRGKYLVFTVRKANREPFPLVGHLGMTGRMYLLPAGKPFPKHAAVVLNLGSDNFVYEDTRYFGRLTLNARAIEQLGPEPLDPLFSSEALAGVLRRSSQAIKVKLLDQSAVAGVGNIYASEALFRAGLSPRMAARRLSQKQVERLWIALRGVLTEAIARGSTLPLDYAGAETRDRLFYFGQAQGPSDFYEERLLVYDRAGQACSNCGNAIKRLVQAARSTFYCPHCQSRRRR